MGVKFQSVKCPSVEAVIKPKDEFLSRKRACVRQLLVYLPLASKTKRPSSPDDEKCKICKIRTNRARQAEVTLP